MKIDKAQLYRFSRILVIQSYYNFHIIEGKKEDVEYILNSVKSSFSELNESEISADFDLEFAIRLFTATIENNSDSEKEIILHLAHNWRFERLVILMQILLKVAISELMQKTTKIAIILNEYTDIASGFFDLEATNFVNAILNKIAKKLNPEN